MSQSGTSGPAFVLHDHRKPSPHFDLRLEQDGVLKSWAVPKGMPTKTKGDRLAVAVADHDLDHLTYTDEHKLLPTSAGGRKSGATTSASSSSCTVSTAHTAMP